MDEIRLEIKEVIGVLSEFLVRCKPHQIENRYSVKEAKCMDMLSYTPGVLEDKVPA